MPSAVIKHKEPRNIPNYTPNKVDRERVKHLVLLGSTEATIAACMGKDGIGVDTLRHYYKEELTRYREQMLGKIAASVYRWALDEADGGMKDIAPEIRARMKMFVLKTRAGWKENDQTVINATNVQIVKRIVGVSDEDV